MDLTIVALYTICDDLLISIGHRNHPQAKMSDAEVMTIALVAAKYFGGNQQTAAAVLKTRGYIPNMLGDTHDSIVVCIRYLNCFKHFLNISQKVLKPKILMRFMSLTLFLWQSVTTFGFHARVSRKVKHGIGRSQVSIATFMVSKHI